MTDKKAVMPRSETKRRKVQNANQVPEHTVLFVPPSKFSGPGYGKSENELEVNKEDINGYTLEAILFMCTNIFDPSACSIKPYPSIRFQARTVPGRRPYVGGSYPAKELLERHRALGRRLIRPRRMILI